jgi:hypothetical protein
MKFSRRGFLRNKIGFLLDTTIALAHLIFEGPSTGSRASS